MSSPESDDLLKLVDELYNEIGRLKDLAKNGNPQATALLITLLNELAEDEQLVNSTIGLHSST